MLLSRPMLAIGLSSALLAAAACQGQSDDGSNPEQSPAAQFATPDDLTTVDSALVGAMDGFQTRSVVDEVRHIHATWPQIPGAEALNDDLTTSRTQLMDDFRTQLMDDFRTDYSPPVAGQVAFPELNATWRLVGASDEVVGVVADDYMNPGASGYESWHTTWYDVDSEAVVANGDLIDDSEALREQITDDLDGREGIFTEELNSTLDEDAIPVVGFTDTGALFVGFDEYQVGAGSMGQVSVVIPVAETDSLLSGFGERARTAALEPDAPGSATTPPSVEPVPTVDPAPERQVNCRKVKCVAITYDDGPASHTEDLLNTLRRKKAVATFFVLGQQVATYPETTRRIVEDGHEIGLHTWDHKNMTQLNPAEIHHQITRTSKEVKATTGVRATLLRPPYGAKNDAVRKQARLSDVALALWSVDTEDWRDRNTSLVVQRAVNQARRGSIILMHDIHGTSVAGAGQIVDGLRDRGFTLVTVTDLIGSPRPGETYFSQP